MLCIGCRTESELDFYREHKYEITGIDVVPGDHLVLDAHEIGEHFYENQFDVVYAVHSIEHMYDVTKVFAGIRKVARLGCFIVIPCYKKYKPDISHPAILDIMLANRKNINKVSPKDLEDFKIMQPFKLSDYSYHLSERAGDLHECQLTLKWTEGE